MGKGIFRSTILPILFVFGGFTYISMTFSIILAIFFVWQQHKFIVFTQIIFS